jgi:hypothetical protein
MSGTENKTLDEVFREAQAVFLVGVPPEQRGDARRALGDFLSRAQAIGYRSGFADGQATPPARSLAELMDDEHTLRDLESTVKDAIRGASARSVTGLAKSQGADL